LVDPDLMPRGGAGRFPGDKRGKGILTFAQSGRRG